MATDAQINANRANAQHSTGPVTAEGKANSSRNHLILGLYTRQDYVKPDERHIYKEFCETMYRELNPASLLEESLVSEITGATWRLRRCNNVEGELADYAPQDPMLDDKTDKTRRSIERARASAHSLLHRSINQLRKLQTESRNLAAEAIDPGLASNCNGDAATAACDQTQTNCNPARPYRHEFGGEDAASGSVASNCPPAPEPPPTAPQIARNAPCPCHSGEKYKRCCGKNSPPILSKAA
jgi:hypothetical protein